MAPVAGSYPKHQTLKSSANSAAIPADSGINKLDNISRAKKVMVKITRTANRQLEKNSRDRSKMFIVLKEERPATVQAADLDV